MAFKAGQSGNPGGRPRAVKEALEKFRKPEDLEKLRARLLEIANSGTVEPKDCIAAIREYHDRAYGKAPQAITGADGEPLIPTNAELESRLAAALAGSVTADDASTEGEPH